MSSLSLWLGCGCFPRYLAKPTRLAKSYNDCTDSLGSNHHASQYNISISRWISSYVYVFPSNVTSAREATFWSSFIHRMTTTSLYCFRSDWICFSLKSQYLSIGLKLLSVQQLPPDQLELQSPVEMAHLLTQHRVLPFQHQFELQ